MKVDDLHGRAVAVTGAGSGIGRATALLCARRGASLHLCDVNEAGLEETAVQARQLGGDVHTRRVDVAQREEVGAFAAAVHERVEAVDLLVNNAGVGLGAGFLDTSLEDWDWIVDINLKGVVYGCHFFAPAMVARGRGGHIVNLSSLAGYLATESLAAYCTTKFAVRGLSEALRDELMRHGIGVTAVCPGIIDTPITSNSRLRGALFDRPEARERMITAYRRRGYGPDRVAENILKAVSRNRAIAPVSAEAWIGHYVQRFTPGLLRRFNQWFGARARRELESGR